MHNILIAKSGQSVAVDFDALPDVSKTYIIEYGLRQSLNDATASLKASEFKTPEEFKNAALAMAEKKLAGILSGELRSAVGRIGDPVEAETMRLAVAMVSTLIIQKNGKLKDYTTKELRDLATATLAKYPAKAEELRAKAEANIAAKAELAEGIEL